MLARATAAFRLRLTTPAQRRRATATLRDNATTISLAWPAIRALAFDSSRRDRQSPGAVCSRNGRDFASATSHDEDRTRCIRDASETLTNGAYMWRRCAKVPNPNISAIGRIRCGEQAPENIQIPSSKSVLPDCNFLDFQS